MWYQTMRTEWGYFGIVGSDAGVAAAYLPGPLGELRNMIASSFPGARKSEDDSTLAESVVEYFRGERVTFRADVDLTKFTMFQRNVLEMCRKLPYGQTTTYAGLAQAVGRSGAARAVGGCMARNPIPLIIPCHRVLRSDFTLGGFSAPGGVDFKGRMLAMEGVALHESDRSTSGALHPRRNRMRAAS